LVVGAGVVDDGAIGRAGGAPKLINGVCWRQPCGRVAGSAIRRSIGGLR